jgi:hypothetical protein
MVCVIDMYDWLVHWRVCGSLVIKVENWSYALGLFSIMVDILPNEIGLFNIMLQKFPYVIHNYVTKFDVMYEIEHFALWIRLKFS